MRTPKLKESKQVILELEEEIKVTEKCMKECIKKENFEEALDCKRSIITFNFVIDLIKGNLD